MPFSSLADQRASGSGHATPLSGATPVTIKNNIQAQTDASRSLFRRLLQSGLDDSLQYSQASGLDWRGL